MKEYHYYAGAEFKAFDEPQDELLAKAALSPLYLAAIWQNHVRSLNRATAKARIPRHIAIDLTDSAWAKFEHCIRITIVDGKSGSEDPATQCAPCDTAELIMEDCTIYIHCRRIMHAEIECCGTFDPA